MFQQKLPDRSKRYVSSKEFAKILQACSDMLDEQQEPWWRTLISVLYSTGLRLNEAIHLTWGDVDFERDFLTVIARDDVLSFQPKGKRSRTIPVPRSTMDLLAKLQLTPESVGRYVFVSKERLQRIQEIKEAGKWRPTQKPLTDLRDTWAKIIKRAGIPRATFHDLRRSAITNWARRIPAHVTQRLAGHVSITTTMQFYVSVLDDDLASARLATEAAIGTADSTRDAVRTQ